MFGGGGGGGEEKIEAQVGEGRREKDGKGSRRGMRGSL